MENNEMKDVNNNYKHMQNVCDNNGGISFNVSPPSNPNTTVNVVCPTNSLSGACVGNNGEISLRKGPWMPEEDEILVDYVKQYGPRDWSSIRAKGLLPRTGKSCRLRWVNKLKPDLKSGCKFSPEEEKLVVEMQAKLGNKWAKIASYLPGRTDNDVKNFWSTRQKRIMRAMQRPKTQSGSVDNNHHHNNNNNNNNDNNNMNVVNGGGLPDISNFPVDPTIPFGSMGDYIGGLQMGPSFKEGMVMVKLQDLVGPTSLYVSPDDMHPPHQQVVASEESSSMSSSIARPKRKRSTSARDTSSHLLDLSAVKRRTERHVALSSTSCHFPIPLSQQNPNNNTSFANFDNNIHANINEIYEGGISFNNNNDTNCPHDLGIDLYMDPNENNILDFLLLQPDMVDSATSRGDMSPLPALESDDLDVHMAQHHSFPFINVKEEQDDTCTPDTVLGGFDMFDSLEPLSLSPSEDWWDSRV